VVGSRHVDDELIRYTECVGRLAAEARHTIVSGAAKGIDRAAMSGALEAGGQVVGVMSDSLEQAALLRDNRELLINDRLVLISPYDPAAGFNVGHAMQRNKLIYALADAALVVNSDFEKGGTWAGAKEQLDRLRLVPVFVRNGANAGKGNSALLQRGAKPWPDPKNGAELTEVLCGAVLPAATEPLQETLFSMPEIVAEPGPTASERLLLAAREILAAELSTPRNENEVADLLGITKPQAKAWLLRFVAEGVLEKLKKPLRYRTAQGSGRLL
jgi:DNA processing protein